MLREPATLAVDHAAGRLVGATGRYEKRLRDLAGLYGDEEAFAALVGRSGDAVVYEVTDYRPSADAGDMILGVTRMAPGRVGGEFFLTRGHIHARADRPEMYRGEAGRGVMLMESPEGELRTVEVAPTVVCYVPPFWIHRSVNVGDDDLVMSFTYPADSGQDYAIIERSGGMRGRVVATDDGGWRLADNPAWRPRSAAEIAAVYATAGAGSRP
jgi:glucose-6-phosphate isomerase, archaeal